VDAYQAFGSLSQKTAEDAVVAFHGLHDAAARFLVPKNGKATGRARKLMHVWNLDAAKHLQGSLTSLAAAMACQLAAGVAKLGTSRWRRKGGTPIGGFASSRSCPLQCAKLRVMCLIIRWRDSGKICGLTKLGTFHTTQVRQRRWCHQRKILPHVSATIDRAHASKRAILAGHTTGER